MNKLYCRLSKSGLNQALLSFQIVEKLTAIWRNMGTRTEL